MPLYEYVCCKCNKTFEKIVSLNSNEPVVCPKCGGENVERVLSVFAKAGNAGGSGCSVPSGSGFS